LPCAALIAAYVVGGIRSSRTGVVHELNISNGTLRTQGRLSGWVLWERVEDSWISRSLGPRQGQSALWKPVLLEALLESVTMSKECSLFKWSDAVADMNELGGISRPASFTPAASQRIASTIVDLWRLNNDPKSARQYIRRLESMFVANRDAAAKIDVDDLSTPPTSLR
jgi:hypothetical protein